jgi:predicted dehydrogenase
LHSVLASGRLGDIVTIEHRENVVYWHMAHSFVRGNWGNMAKSSPMILAKCCHDLDILYWNVNQPVKRLQSFGSLIHFRPENAPPGATSRCTDGCPAAETCPFDSRRLYLNPNYTGWPIVAITDDLSLEGRQKALEKGPYGRCVYQCDNDVVDHQTVNMEFAGGTSAVLFMHGHSYEEGRTMRYDGTRATLRAKFTYGSGEITIHDHLTGRVEDVPVDAVTSGHGGGDFGVVRSFVAARRGESEALTNARESLESHLMAFAAEESRLNGTVVDMAAFREKAEKSTP